MTVAVVLVAVLAACGSDPAPTRADFRSRVNSECRAVRKAVRKVDAPAGAGPAVLIRSGRRALVLQRAAVRNIAAVPRPLADRARITRWLAGLRRALDSVGGSLDAQARVDLAAANQANATGAALVQRAEHEARALGLDDCVTPTTG